MSEQSLIGLLADGRFHSGEELGGRLGVSRAAVWKRLKRLESLGLYTERVRGKGYRLPGGIDLLDERRLRSHCEGRALELPLEIVSRTGSTNADMLEALRAGQQAPRVLLAEYQSAGRGRRGRAWVSPFGGSIYLSLAWPFSGGASALEGLSLGVGVALAQVLAREGLREGVGLKWPNDVLVHHRKLAGVLIELAGDLDGHCTAVIGVGVNGTLNDLAGDSIDQHWTDLKREMGELPDRSRLAGRLISSLVDMLERFVEQGFEAVSDDWAEYDLCAGRTVRVLVGERSSEGLALGVDSAGALRVRISGEERLFHGGEVSVRFGDR